LIATKNGSVTTPGYNELGATFGANISFAYLVGHYYFPPPYRFISKTACLITTALILSAVL